MAAADRRRQAAGQGLVAQESIEIGRNIGNADGMALGRDAGVKISQRVLVIESSDFRQDRSEQIDGSIRLLNETPEMLFVSAAAMGPALAFPQRTFVRSVIL